MSLSYNIRFWEVYSTSLGADSLLKASVLRPFHFITGGDYICWKLKSWEEVASENRKLIWKNSDCIHISVLSSDFSVKLKQLKKNMNWYEDGVAVGAV